MKSARNVISGIIIGIMLTVTATAAVQEYTLKKSECKIIVDGVEVKGELPLLIMDPGYNYIPAAEFRSICDKIGIGFEFDVPTKEVRIETRQAQIETKEVEAMKIAPTKTVPEGFEAYQINIVNNKQYIGTLYVRNKIRRDGYELERTENVADWANVSGGEHYDNWKITKDGKTILDNIPAYKTFSYSSIEVEYYLNVILPLID